MPLKAGKAMAEWFSPPQIARARRLRVGKVLGWIRSGELAAVNCATHAGRRPRWRVRADALAAFDQARSNRVNQQSPRPQRQRSRPEDLVEYF
jgi:hypothetical protein